MPISTNEFYYGLALPDVEKKAKEFASSKPRAGLKFQAIQIFATLLNNSFLVELPSAESSLPTKGKRVRNRSKSRKQKKAELLEKTSKVQAKMENLKITVRTEKAKAGSSREKNKQPERSIAVNGNSDEGDLLARLKLLQSGKVTSVQLQKSAPLILPALKPKTSKALDKEEEIRRNKAEVQRLNKQIKEKIERQVKPKLRRIAGSSLSNTDNQELNETSRNIRKQTCSESLQNEIPHTLSVPKPVRDVPVVKTPVKNAQDEEAEIFRYTRDDLHQLQFTATYELVPKLLDLDICGSIKSEYDALILKLLNVKNEDDRSSIILDAAEKRSLIKRTGGKGFEFCKVPVSEGVSVTKTPRKPMNEVSKISEIEAIFASSKNEEELHEMLFRYEFCQLFGDCFKADDFKNHSIEKIVEHLVETNKACIVEGDIRVNAKNNHEAYLQNPKGKRDICLPKLVLRKHAFHGDFVKVLMKQGTECEGVSIEINLDSSLALAESGNRNYGCVLEILEKRHSRRVIGSIVNDKKSEKRYVVFAVRDPKIPHVRIYKDGFPKDVAISDKTLTVVEITSWLPVPDPRGELPKGRIVEIIGEKDQLKTENAAILLQHNLSALPFSQSILDQLPADPFVIPEQEFSYRQDLRKKCIFSIDPETARDLDDALSCEVLPNGNLEVGVHISDVSYFLKENCELDEIVKEKATTIYLVDAVYHMLPVPLCLLCSLLPGADKMAYSVFWEMKPETAEIVSTRFTRSVVNSCAKLSYDHAQKVIEKPDNNWSDLEKDFPEISNGFTVSHIAEIITILQKLALLLRNGRKTSGALKIDQPKISFKFDKDDQLLAPTDFFQYCIKDSNRLIEEFMLLANISVAKFISEKFPEISLLRNHDPPNGGGLKKLVKTLQCHQVDLDTSSSSALSASMEKLIANAKSVPGMNAALNLMVSKTMTRARYFCSGSVKEDNGFWHYALSIPIYTHFTSPIRRYADILVHRVLNAALSYEEAPTRSPDEVQKLANICNAQKYSAKLAGEDSSDLYFMQFIKSLKTRTMSAGVLGIYEYNLEVVLIETGHVLKVFYKVSSSNHVIWDFPNLRFSNRNFNRTLPLERSTTAPLHTLPWFGRKLTSHQSE